MRIMSLNSSSFPLKSLRALGFRTLAALVLSTAGGGLSSCFSPPISKNLPAASSEGKALASNVQKESNRVRGVNGLGTLSSNPALTAAAETQARFLVANVAPGKPMPKAIVHYDFPARSTRVMRENSMTLTAEIVVAMPPGRPSPSSVVSAWMASSGHRAKLLGSWDLTGTGAAKAADGTWFVVQWFAKSRP